RRIDGAHAVREVADARGGHEYAFHGGCQFRGAGVVALNVADNGAGVGVHHRVHGHGEAVDTQDVVGRRGQLRLSVLIAAAQVPVVLEGVIEADGAGPHLADVLVVAAFVE